MRCHLALPLCLALPLLACGGASGGGDASAADPITVSGRITQFGTDPPVGIEGVQTCLHPEDTQCVTSGPDGAILMVGVPARSRILISLVKQGFASALITSVTEEEDLTDAAAALAQPGAIELVFNPTGVVIDWAKGHIVFFADDGAAEGGGGKAGVSASLSPAPSPGSGPHYLGDGVIPLTDMSLEATSPTGAGGFVNLASGSHTMTLSGGGTCSSSNNLGWVGTEANTFDVPVEAGFITYVVGACQ